MSADREAADLLIVGGGPAGLAAAIEARRLGLTVRIVEREAEPGGIARHCGHRTYGVSEFGRLLTGPAYARRLAEKARAAGVAIETQTSVIALQEGPRLTVSRPDGLATIAARRLLLATGVRETSRAGRLIGGTKPRGVLNTGALQGLVYLKGRLPFRRPAVLGTELVAFSALLTLRHAGVQAAAMIEPGGEPVARAPSAMLPRLLGVPLLLETRVAEVIGGDQVTALCIEREGGRERLEADGLIVCGGFRPETAMLAQSHIALDEASGGPAIDQYGRTSDPDIFAAGNLLRGVETAAFCVAEGRAAARAIAQSLHGALPDPAPALALRPGEGLSLVVPQRLVQGPRTGVIQLRASRRIKGRLAIRIDGETVATRRLDTRPQRRILLPASLVPPQAVGVADILMEEGP